jgi:hypothetical protein
LIQRLLLPGALIGMLMVLVGAGLTRRRRLV